MTDPNITYPPEWGNDPLSEYINLANHNAVSCFTIYRPLFNKLNDIHVFYSDLISSLNNISNEHIIDFLFNAHNSFLASVRLAVCGQTTQSYMLLRSCIENSLYGHYIQKNPDTWDIWINRDDSPQAKAEMRNTFRITNLRECLHHDDNELSLVIQKLYEMTIDCGAHPNVNAVYAAAALEIHDDSRTHIYEYFNCRDPFWKTALVNTAQVGICSLEIFRYVFKQRYELGLFMDRLDQLKVEP